jgi:hypothetical protein
MLKDIASGKSLSQLSWIRHNPKDAARIGRIQAPSAARLMIVAQKAWISNDPSSRNISAGEF